MYDYISRICKLAQSVSGIINISYYHLVIIISLLCLTCQGILYIISVLSIVTAGVVPRQLYLPVGVNQFCRFTSLAWPRCWAALVR